MGQHIKRVFSLLLLTASICGPLLVFAQTGTAMAATNQGSNWDTRPCRAIPGVENCNGKLPGAPTGTAPSDISKGGSGACFDNTAQYIQQDFTQTVGMSDGTQQTQMIASLQLWWLRTCNSYAAEVTVTRLNLLGTQSIPPTIKVSITDHPVDSTQDNSLLDQVLNVGNWFNITEVTKPIMSYDAWSPMIYSTNNVVSTCTTITPESGFSLNPICMAGTVKNGKLVQHSLPSSWIQA